MSRAPEIIKLFFFGELTMKGETINACFGDTRNRNISYDIESTSKNRYTGEYTVILKRKKEDPI